MKLIKQMFTAPVSQHYRQIATILGASLLLQACEKPTEYKVPVPIVEVFEIPNQQAEKVQLFPAVVNAADLTELSFRVNGQILKLPVESGMRVKKGDILAQLDPKDFNLEVDDKKAKRELSQVTLKRSKYMLEQDNMSQSRYDEIEAKFRIDNALFEESKTQLSYVEIKAPFDGIISSVPAENYENTAVGKTVLTMHRADKLEIKVDLPDIVLAAASTVELEHKTIVLDVVLDAYPDHVFKGRYKEHTTEQNQESKTFTLILEIDQDPHRIALQGMPGSVRIDLSRIKSKKLDTYNVPLEAVKLPDNVHSSSDQRVVWRVNNGVAEKILVTATNFGSIDKLAVSGDIQPGDKIVVSGMNYLSEGGKVKIKK